MIRPCLFFLLGLMVVIGSGGDTADPMRDASVDDGGPDSGSGDGGPDSGLECFELPPAGRALGGECGRTASECDVGLGCIEEFAGTIGGPDDPIMNYPPGENVPLDAPLFVDSYCTLPDTGTEAGCDPAACEAECGFCTLGICMNACIPEVDTNSTCRDGYDCDLLGLVCFPGCTSHDECRIFREDTNDNGEVDPWDPDTLTGDRLVYDTNSSAVCNPVTYRCEHSGTDGAEAGDPCTTNEDCEANGVCLSSPGGYCSKVGCDIPGNECAGDAICDLAFCVAPCQVGAGATPGDSSTYLNQNPDCRDGYTCIWRAVDDTPGGFCDVGVSNDVTINNIGADCVENDECYSPFGLGLCGNGDFVCDLFGEPEESSCVGFGCTVLDCGAPGIPSDVCGDDATCVFLSETFSLCLKTCSMATIADDCLPGAACGDIDLDGPNLDFACFPFCRQGECRPGEVCDITGRCTAP